MRRSRWAVGLWATVVVEAMGLRATVVVEAVGLRAAVVVEAVGLWAAVVVEATGLVEVKPKTRSGSPSPSWVVWLRA